MYGQWLHMKSDNFYKYIVKSGNYYKIVKDNTYWGSYRRLTDALYERDRFIECDWIWDDVLQLAETENKYEHMDLPEFKRDFTYVHMIPTHYKVYKGTKYLDYFVNKKDAYDYAEEVDGRVVSAKVKFRVQKYLNGRTEHFGQFDNVDDAIKRRDEMLEKGWVR